MMIVFLFCAFWVSLGLFLSWMQGRCPEGGHHVIGENSLDINDDTRMITTMCIKCGEKTTKLQKKKWSDIDESL